MQCYWERIGVLGPTYRLLGRGWSNRDIAKYLNRTEVMVDDCVQWLLRFLKRRSREDLVFVLGTESMPERRSAPVNAMEVRISQ